MAYTWMSEPTKVTRTTKVIDSGSTSVPKSILKSPAGIQENRVEVIRREASSAPSIWATITAPTMKENQEAQVARR